MRKGKKTKKLNRVTSHRKAMMQNLATSLLEHEQIITTRAKAKYLRPFVERLITRAIWNLNSELPLEKKLHNKRYVYQFIKKRKVVVKLFEDIAKRNQNRKGGYLRIIHLPERKSDSAQMSIIELVEKQKVRKIPRRELKKQQQDLEKQQIESLKRKEKKKELQEASQAQKKPEKWYHRFRFGKKNQEDK